VINMRDDGYISKVLHIGHSDKETAEARAL